MKQFTLILCLLSICSYHSIAQYYPEKEILILTKDEEVEGAEHISMITYSLPLDPNKAYIPALINVLTAKAKGVNGNVIKLLSLKTIVSKREGYLCYAVIMRVPDPANVTYISLEDFYYKILDELVEDPNTQSMAIYFTCPLPNNRLVKGDRGILMTMEDSFSCFFEKQTVCSYVIPNADGGELFYFMMMVEKKEKLTPIEVHYKDGYHICKEYERLNALKEEEDK